MRDFYTKKHEHEWQDKGIRKITIQEYRTAVPQHEIRDSKMTCHKYRSLIAYEETKVNKIFSFFKYQQLNLTGT